MKKENIPKNNKSVFKEIKNWKKGSVSVKTYYLKDEYKDMLIFRKRLNNI